MEQTGMMARSMHRTSTRIEYLLFDLCIDQIMNLSSPFGGICTNYLHFIDYEINTVFRNVFRVILNIHKSIKG